jgi:4-amino-4-deoxy-L-arabinose transferase-like glycosyltransferase
VVRLVYVFGPGRHVRGYGDYHYFHESANLIASGHWFVDPVATLGHPVGSLPSATHPPLWTLLLGAVSWAGGTTELAHRAFGCLVGAVAIVLIGLLGRRVGGERVGLVAALIAAVYPVLIAADGSLMSESLYGALIAGVLLLAFEMRSRPRTWTAVALGAVIALAALTRAEALALLLLLVLPVTVAKAPPGGLRRFGVCAAACLLVLSPWIARNWIEFGRPVLISTNDGSLVAGANCDQTYHGKDLGLWTTNCLSPRVFSNEADQAARWRSDAVTYAGDHAGRLPVVLGARVLRTFDLYQPWRMTPFAEGRLLKADKLGVIAYFVLLPCAIFGAYRLRQRRWVLLILLAPVALVVLQSLVGYGFPRFRHPVDLVMVVLGAVALVPVRLRQ